MSKVVLVLHVVIHGKRKKEIKIMESWASLAVLMQGANNIFIYIIETKKMHAKKN